MRRTIIYSLLIGSGFLILSNWFWTKYTLQQQSCNKANMNCNKHPRSLISCEGMIRETIYTCSISTQLNLLTPNFNTDDYPRTYLTIGIPSVRRKSDNYLFHTLQSIFKGSSQDELKNITIVVLVADVNPIDRHSRIKEIKSAFQEHIKSGLIHIIETSSSVYPSFINLHQTYNDSMERVHWRSKQINHHSGNMNKENYSTFLCQFYNNK